MMVSAYWHMNLNCGASNRIELKAKRTVVVTVATLSMELGHVRLNASAEKTTRLLSLSGHSHSNSTTNHLSQQPSRATDVPVSDVSGFTRCELKAVGVFFARASKAVLH